MARGMAGSATLSVTAVEGKIEPDALPELPGIQASVGMLEGAALYHENGYYETVDLIGADSSRLGEINPPRLADGGEISDFTGNQVDIAGPLYRKIRDHGGRYGHAANLEDSRFF